MPKKFLWRRLSKLLVGVIGIASIVFMVSLLFPRLFPSVLVPFANAGVEIGGWWSEFFITSESVRAENTRLKDQLTALAFDRVELETLRQENVDIRAQLGFIERQSFSHVTAQVILRSAHPTHVTFVIDRGREDGIVVGAPVIVQDGVLIGKIIDVGRVTSTALALTDPRSKIASSVLTSSRTLGIAEGGAGSLLSLRFIPQDEAVYVNDLVVTSGLEENIPPGLVIGVVNRVTDDRSAPFQEASVEPIVDSFASSVVSVLVPYIP